MKKLIAKTSGQSGLTLIEMVAAIAVLALLASAMTSGLAVSTRSYRESVFVSDSETLCDTISIALSDILRYAAYESTDASGIVFFANEEYSIPSSGRLMNENGRIYIASDGNQRLIVNSGAYTSLDVQDFTMQYDEDTNTYSGTYTVASKDGAMTKACEFAYRSLR